MMTKAQQQVMDIVTKVLAEADEITMGFHGVKADPYSLRETVMQLQFRITITKEPFDGALWIFAERDHLEKVIEWIEFRTGEHVIFDVLTSRKDVKYDRPWYMVRDTVVIE